MLPLTRSYAGIDSRASQIPDTETDDGEGDLWDMQRKQCYLVAAEAICGQEVFTY